MEVLLIPLLILFFILVAGFGIENTLKILPPLIILGLLIYFLGWVVVKYFWIILPIWFLNKLLSNKNKGNNSSYSRTYRRTNDDFFNSSSTNRRTYSGTFNSREEAEEFFRTFFGGGFRQGTGGTYGGYNSQNNRGSYQKNTYGTYTTDKSKYYSILGVSSEASQDEIKKAYPKLAKEHHPDKYVNSSDSEKKYHENKMKEINEAYENLTK